MESRVDRPAGGSAVPLLSEPIEGWLTERGLAIVDACVAWAGTRFDCSTNPRITPQFLADQDATNNRVLNNLFSHNGVTPPPSPFAFAASDIALLSFGAGNCFSNNSFITSFSLLGVLPPCW